MFVDSVEASADIARAVNTVKIEIDKTLSAFNTDIIGFQNAAAGVNLRGKKAAILGTGGAAHAVVAALDQMGVKEITIFTRSIPNSIEKMSFFRKKFEHITFNVLQIEKIGGLSEFSMLVNATPIGMLGNSADMTPVSSGMLATMGNDAVVYDLIYNPRKTILIKNAEKLGLKAINGLDMLIHQAAAAQKIWLGKEPSIALMKLAALEELTN
jgi:shikimate dehydrogenase